MFFSAGTANAQHEIWQGFGNNTQKRSTLVESMQRSGMTVEKRYPGLPRVRKAEGDGIQSLPHRTSAKVGRNVKLASTADGKEIWGNVIWSNAWKTSYDFGYYSFNASSNTGFTPLAINDNFMMNGSSVLFDGKVHGVCYNTNSDGSSITAIKYYEFDVDSWAETDNSGQDLPDPGYVANCLTYDDSDGKVYGSFTNGTYTWDVCFGTIDYNTMTYNNITSWGAEFRTIAADGKGKLYVIKYDGTLATINKETGETTDIGPTGVDLANMLQSAVIDKQTGVMYWAAYLNDGTSGLYTVNLTTGEASLITKFSNSEQITGLYIPEKYDDALPAKPTALATTFEEGTQTGTVSFTMPTATVGGTAINGEISYRIVANGETVKSGKAQVGAEVKEQITLPTGRVKLQVYAENDKGSSPCAAAYIWIGKDEPLAVANLKMNVTIDKTKATLYWDKAVAKHNGYMNPDDVRYKVVRYPGGETVASDIKETTYTDNLPSIEYSARYYEVIPSYEGKEGPATRSNIRYFGNPINLPFEDSFSSEIDFGRYSIVDGNRDGYTWYLNNGAVQYDYARSGFSADEYLLTPPLQLDNEHLYKVSFKYYTGGQTHRIEILSKKENTFTNAYTTVMPKTEYTSTKAVDVSAYFRVASNGGWNIAIHEISDAMQYIATVDDIKIEAVASVMAPDSVTNFWVEPGEKGALNAKLHFTTPAKRLNGEALTDLTALEIQRDGNTVATIPATEAGKEMTVNDASAENGMHTYTIVPVSGDAKGMPSSASAYVGIDTPEPVKNITVKDNLNGTATIAWEKPDSKGIHGGYVDVNSFSYKVCKYENYDLTPITKVSGLTANVDIDNNAEQALSSFGIIPESVGGDGEANLANIITGKSYTLPFIEGFANKKTNYPVWLRDQDDTMGNGFVYCTNASSDDDGGSVVLTPVTANAFKGELNASLQTGKIDISKAEKPVLYFNFLRLENSSSKLNIAISRNDEKPDTLGIIPLGKELTQSIDGPKKIIEIPSWYSITLRDTHKNAPYGVCAVDLSAFKDASYITIHFTGVMTDPDFPIDLDDIRVYDLKQKDIAAEISAPSKTVAGAETYADVKVRNNGEQTVPSYKISLYADSKKVGESTVENLEQFKKNTTKIKYTPAVNKAGKEIEVYATVDCDGDENAADNTTATSKVKLTAPCLPVVNDLTYRNGSDGTTLNWSEMKPKQTAVTETFDEYEPFIIDGIGQWTVYDGDKCPTYGFEDYKFAHEFEPMAYQTFDSEFTGYSEYDIWKGHSGLEYLNCYATNTNKGIANDDWLISPLLSGEAQTISAWARSFSDQYGLESFEILYSTTGKETIDFKKISAAQAPTSWTEYTAELPAGTRYFAIHCTSKDKFIFQLDDITYRPGLTVKSYNVYRNGELIGSVPAGTTTFFDEGSKGATYNVTVVYETAESAFSNDAADAAGIGSANAQTIRIAGTTGFISISGAEGKQVEVFNLAGQKTFSANGNADMLIRQKSGSYIVKVGKHTAKVIVR